MLRMRDVLRHRGPDDSGLLIDGPVGLAHRRLSIVGLATGHQPMSNAAESIHLVFNGEIYNHADYRQILGQKGRVFRTQSDTEVIIHLYEEYGDKCVDRLRGMFGFALWDSHRKRLLLARDRLGIKPLYYHQSADGALYFGSEIKAIFESGVIRPEINMDVLPDLLANQAPSGEDTLYKGIKRLPAGHTLVWENGEIQLRQYWDTPFEPSGQEAEMSDSEYVDKWRDKFQNAVESHLMADVPVGVLLSGGIDSTAIAAMMSRTLDRKFKSFSVAFAEKEANELSFARLAAQAYKTDHHELIVSPAQYFESLPKMIWQEDEPIAHVASVPLYFVSQLASEHVKVVLSGEGSDELMAGYGRYPRTVYNLSIGQKYDRVVPDSIQDLLATIAHKLRNNRFGQKLSRTFICREPTVKDLYFDNFSIFSEGSLSSLLSSKSIDAIGKIDPYRHQLDLYNKVDSLDTLHRLLYVDLKVYLQELLMKQDQMSMAASLESRVPFLDHELVEFTTRMPARLKLRKRTTKYVLRKAMEDLIPSQILNRKKMGFPVPVGKWFRNDYSSLIDEYVLGSRVRDRGMFDHGYIEQMVARHHSGQEDHSQRLWTLLNLELWLRQAIDGEHFDTATQSIVSLRH
jgi:asparagine synthase (glutamine-hydrolysing)